MDSEHSNPSPKLHCKLHHHLLQGIQGTSAWKCHHVSPWLSVERKYLLGPKEKEGSSTIYGLGVMVKGFQFLTDSNSRRLSQRFGGSRHSLVRFFFSLFWSSLQCTICWQNICCPSWCWVSFSVKVQASDTGIIESDFVVQCIFRNLRLCKLVLWQWVFILETCMRTTIYSYPIWWFLISDIKPSACITTVFIV